MVGFSSPARLVSKFESQFEEDGNGGYVYRLRGKGRPIPVGAVERRHFVAQYAFRVFLIWGAMFAAFSLFVLTFYWKVITTAANVLPSSVIFSDPFFYEGLILTVLPASTLMFWLGEAPARALRDRASIGPEPTHDQKQAIAFRKTSYFYLAFLAMIGGASALNIAGRALDPRWMVVPALIVLVATVQIFRKWRFERRHPELR